MGESIAASEQSNCETFRECLSEPVIRALAAPMKAPKQKKKKKYEKKGSKSEINDIIVKSTEETAQGDAEDLGEFIDYLSSLIFPCLPDEVRSLSYPKIRDSAKLQNQYSTPLSIDTATSLLNTIPPTAIDSLESYSLLPLSSGSMDLRNFFVPVLSSYISSATAPPPIWSTTRTTECELCQRDWINLTYHHLIPRSTHKRVMKRGWHDEERLNSVAWLCRACHSFVHRLASNEELAKSYYTVDLIRDGGTEQHVDKKQEVEAWVKWVAGVRWKSR